MKRLFVLLLLVVFWICAYIYPQKIEAGYPVYDGASWMQDLAQYAKEIKHWQETYKKWKEETQQWTEEFGRLGHVLDVDTKGILGEYGLGELTPVMDKLLKGAGLQDLLKVVTSNGTQVNIGAGGILSGALEGVFGREDTISAILGQFGGDAGLKIPPGIADKLKNLGIFDSQRILEVFTRQSDVYSGGDSGLGDDALGRIKGILKGFGLDMDVSVIKKMVAEGVLDKDVLLSYAAPETQETVEVGAYEESPCVNFEKLDQASKDNTPAFFEAHEAEPLEPDKDPALENEVCTAVASSLPAPGGGFLKLSTEPSELVLTIFTNLLAVIGGIALILIMLSGYKIMVSRGNPEAIQEGRDQLIAALVGLVFIILSFVIYQVVFVDVLRIPDIGAKNSASNPNTGTNPDPNTGTNPDPNTGTNPDPNPIVNCPANPDQDLSWLSQTSYARLTYLRNQLRIYHPGTSDADLLVQLVQYLKNGTPIPNQVRPYSALQLRYLDPARDASTKQLIDDLKAGC